MAIRGKHYSVNVRARREEGLDSSVGLIVLRQSKWGERNGETTLATYKWGDCMSKLETPCGVASLDEDDLVNLIAGASAMLTNIRSRREQREDS
jgi:hypothetical protein